MYNRSLFPRVGTDEKETQKISKNPLTTTIHGNFQQRSSDANAGTGRRDIKA
jgi:hypothetical protein